MRWRATNTPDRPEASSGGATDPVVAAAVRTAAEFLADAGYDVREVEPPSWNDALTTWMSLLLGDFASIRAELNAVMGPSGTAVLDATYALAPRMDPKGLSGVFVHRHRIAREWSMFFVDYPLLLTPTWARLPFEHGFDADSVEGTAASLEALRPVWPANLLGLPSACVPATRDAETGLPIGVLVTGARADDFLCLDAAEAIEARSTVRTPIDPITA